MSLRRIAVEGRAEPGGDGSTGEVDSRQLREGRFPYPEKVGKSEEEAGSDQWLEKREGNAEASERKGLAKRAMRKLLKTKGRIGT